MTGLVGRGGSRGQALVEFAVSAFLLVTVLLSVIEMTRFLLVYTALDIAARAGTRYAIVHGDDRTGSGVDGPSGPGSYTQVQTVVKNFASTGALNAGNVTVNVNYIDGNNTVGSRVEVQAVYLYDPFIGWFSQLSGFSLQSKSRGVIVF
jgi:Flp pilus assembly protein TadG